MKARLTARGVLAAAMVFLSSGASWAQPSMSLSGVALDPLGWKVAGVEVSARETGSNRTRKARTDDAGRCEFRELAAGEYVVEAIKSGFKPRSEPVTLRRADVRLDLPLELGEAAEEIAVWGAKPDATPAGATKRVKGGKPRSPKARSACR